MSGLKPDSTASLEPKRLTEGQAIVAAILLSWLRHHPVFTNEQFLVAFRRAITGGLS